MDVSCQDDGAEVSAALTLAASLRFGPSAVLPVNLADLPLGLAANEIIIQGDVYPKGHAQRVMMTLMSDLGPAPSPSLDPDDAKRHGMKSVFAVVETLATYTEVDPLTIGVRVDDIAGRDTWLRTTREGPEGSVTVCDLAVVDGSYVLSLNSTDFTVEELIQLATSMQLAHPLSEESRWYPIVAALGDR